MQKTLFSRGGVLIQTHLQYMIVTHLEKDGGPILYNFNKMLTFFLAKAKIHMYIYVIRFCAVRTMCGKCRRRDARNRGCVFFIKEEEMTKLKEKELESAK